MVESRSTVLCIIALIVAGVYFTGTAGSEGGRNIKDSPQYRDGSFRNPNGVKMSFFTREIVDVSLQYIFDKRSYIRPTDDMPTVPVRAPEWTDLDPARLLYSWLNHSSVLIALEGQLILADPVFEQRVSPVTWYGPDRFFQPPITAAGLPPLTAVLITHDHYDHLEKPTIIALKNKTEFFLVPLGIGSLLAEWGVAAEKIVELDWWEKHEHKGVTYTATPAVHYSSRGLFDGNQRLWCSWSVSGSGKSFFISGDSGYFDGFKEIGAKLGPFDIAFLKIGAYNDKGDWRRLHMTPEEAVSQFVDLQGKTMVPLHWATFDMALHSWHEPIERAVKEANKKNVPLVTPLAGQLVDNESPPSFDTWWRGVK